MARNSISDFTVKAIKEIPITTILEKEGIEYKKVGREAVTLCPWHNDKNPSLTINDDSGFCYCFVCRIGNDGIGLVQQKLGLSFVDTIERIARSNEIDIVYENIDPELALREARQKALILNQLNEQQESYRKFIKDPRAERIRDILAERKIEPSTSKYFGLGYCPKGFFGDRITIPIHDHRGNLVGFTGRATKDSVKPKYKNSENSDCFDKSKIVFNEHRAIREIPESDSVIFVEGHLDVISLWQIGIKNTVAMQGTAAPSEAIVRRIARRTKRFILCFDADEGGNKAIEQFIKVAGPMACKGQITISIAQLPFGTDPDQCIRENLVDMFNIIENGRPWLDWQLDSWLSNLDRNDTARFTEIENNIRSLVESIQSPVLRQYYIDKASKSLSPDPGAAIKIANNWVQHTSSIKTKKIWLKPDPLEVRLWAEKQLIRSYIHFPETRDQLRSMMSKIHSPAYRWLWQRIKEIEQYSNDPQLSHHLMAVLCISEPYYTRQLRPVIAPTINLRNEPGIINHISSIVNQELVIDGI
jgi:DNA primase